MPCSHRVLPTMFEIGSFANAREVHHAPRPLSDVTNFRTGLVQRARCTLRADHVVAAMNRLNYNRGLPEMNWTAQHILFFPGRTATKSGPRKAVDLALKPVKERLLRHPQPRSPAGYYVLERLQPTYRLAAIAPQFRPRQSPNSSLASGATRSRVHRVSGNFAP